MTSVPRNEIFISEARLSGNNNMTRCEFVNSNAKVLSQCKIVLRLAGSKTKSYWYLFRPVGTNTAPMPTAAVVRIIWQKTENRSRVGAVALYTVLWTVVVKYRKWPFSAPHRTKTP
jgi:hypothetical protein